MIPKGIRDDTGEDPNDDNDDSSPALEGLQNPLALNKPSFLTDDQGKRRKSCIIDFLMEKQNSV